MFRNLALALALVAATPALADIPEAVAGPTDYKGAWEAWLRAERADQVARLHAYADAGAFPRHPESPGYEHVFLDANGTPCAVANLIIQSGRYDLAYDASVTNNGVVVGELTEGPLVDWVLTSGLTIEEVAVIQEPGWEPMVQPAPIDTKELRKQQMLTEREQARIRAHLAAVIAVIEVDTDSAIATAMERLGDRVDSAPPAMPAS
jgi:hypothetical protein